MASYFELAHLANYVYGEKIDYLSKHAPGWFPIGGTESSDDKFNPGRNGFYACIYEHFVTKECVLAIKGTSSVPDVVSDWDFFLDNYMKHNFIPELGQLMKYMFTMRVHYPEYSYSTITGHSLGGILAKMAATITGDAKKILAFNSPGVQAALKLVPSSIMHHPEKVETIITYGDDVGNYHKNNDIGNYIEIPIVATNPKTRVLERVAIVGASGSTGALGGAGIGALVGSTIGPIGTVIGGVIGAVGAGGVSALLGEGLIEYKEHSMDLMIKSMNENLQFSFGHEF